MNNLIEYLKEQIGINVELCDFFDGIRTHNGRKYINIVFKNQLWNSKEYDTLVEYIAKYKTIFSHVEPNGVRRASLFFK